MININYETGIYPSLLEFKKRFREYKALLDKLDVLMDTIYDIRKQTQKQEIEEPKDFMLPTLEDFLKRNNTNTEDFINIANNIICEFALKADLREIRDAYNELIYVYNNFQKSNIADVIEMLDNKNKRHNKFNEMDDSKV